MQYLDRFNFGCPDRKAISEFYVTRSGCTGEKIRFKYKCCSVITGFKNCETVKTPANEATGKGLQYYDRHNVQCPGNKVIVAIEHKWTGGNLYVAVSCCDTKDRWR